MYTIKMVCGLGGRSWERVEAALSQIVSTLASKTKTTKEYIENLPKKGRLRRGKSPCGTPWFFVKENDELREAVDYPALN